MHIMHSHTSDDQATTIEQQSCTYTPPFNFRASIKLTLVAATNNFTMVPTQQKS